MIRVCEAGIERREAALSLIFGHLSPPDREARVAEVLEQQAAGSVCLDGLLLAEAKGEPAGAALVVEPADAPVFIWPPSVRADLPYDAVADALLREMVRRIDASAAWLGQCLLEPVQKREQAALLRNGFTRMTELRFMQRPLDLPLPPPNDIPFDVSPYSAANADEFAAVIERTYVGTHDCPELNGTRSGREAIRTHRTAGEFDPSRWWLFRLKDNDVGVLLLSDHPDQNAWEVVYVGVVPEARGNGYGAALLWHGVRAAQRANRDSLLLAVDCRNAFAISAYEKLGFVDAATRVAFVRLRKEAASRE